MRNLYLLVLAIAVAACGPAGSSSNPDGAPVDAERTIDAGPPADAPPDEFGDPCDTAADCAGGVCVDGPIEDVCTFGCTADCPLGWECRVTEVDGVLASLCLPVVVSQCVACTDDDQCPGGACIELDGGNYCLPGCFEGSCPDGYTCGDDPSGEHAGGFCIPDTGSCDCNADNDGAVRTCMNANGVGTCYGVEICDADSGWGACNAPDATPEVCDGADNDCDFLIDDGVAGGLSCNITNANGTCAGVTLCTGIGGTICQGQTPSAEVCDYTDNNCNAMIDEGYPGTGDLCSDGDGVCERFGVIRCNSAGDGTECSAVAGSPTGELCNGLDDDCMGDIDETFTTLGDPCTAGVGVCARQGNLICDVPQTGTTCSATPGSPGTETCNLLDDDCSGVVDEDWKTGGLYTANTACGSCAVDCTVIYDLTNASGSCVVSGTPGCVMSCDAGTYNLNGQVADGCEFVLDPLAIYVSFNDTGANDVLGAATSGCGRGPVGTVAGYHPCRTLAAGMSQATTLGKTKVFVANAMYTDQLTLVNGRSMYGGYLPNLWTRDVAATGTSLLGTKPAGGSNEHVITVDASGINTATVFDGFVVFGAVAPGARGNSYAIYAGGATNLLTISNNVIFGGKGGAGTSGAVGADGTDGSPGAGRASNPAGFDARLANTGAGPCNIANNRPSSGGAVMMCGGANVSGGDGGGNECPLTSDCTQVGSACSGTSTFWEDSALVGVNGQAGGGAAGLGGGNGYDMTQDNTYCYLASQPTVCSISHRYCDTSGSFNCAPADGTCSFVIGPNYGTDGTNGGDAPNGTSGPGCSATGGSLVGGHWQGSSGTNGTAGGNGGGGGGGGAGGGARCKGCVNAFDNLGAHGGGGGGGGCGGELGAGATSGGGAFGIFLVGSTTGPVITANRIVRGEGGAGGAGGAGGQGGVGGAGGDGGLSAVFCAELAGRGGNGGDGGHGAGGGGGCGGASDAIRTYGITGTPNYCTLTGTAANTITGGGGGLGGAGGYSISTPGGAGTQPAVGACVYNP